MKISLNLWDLSCLQCLRNEAGYLSCSNMSDLTEEKPGFVTKLTRVN
jgi:hypothetical protein